MVYEPTAPELAAFLVRVGEAVAGRRVRLSAYALEGAASLEWTPWDVGEQLRDLAARDWLRCDQSDADLPDRPRPSLIWVFEPEFWDGGKLWIRLVERDGVLVISFHKG